MSESMDAKIDLSLFREQVAYVCHELWSGWMKYLFSKGTMHRNKTWTMHREYVERWQRQMHTPYPGLLPDEQDSDRKEADKFLSLLDLLTPAPWTSDKKKSKDLLNTVQLTYRKHCLGDDTIGWHELNTALLNTLCNVMGDKAFNEWLKQYSDLGGEE